MSLKNTLKHHQISWICWNPDDFCHESIQFTVNFEYHWEQESLSVLSSDQIKGIAKGQTFPTCLFLKRNLHTMRYLSVLDSLFRDQISTSILHPCMSPHVFCVQTLNLLTYGAEYSIVKLTVKHTVKVDLYLTSEMIWYITCNFTTLQILFVWFHPRHIPIVKTVKDHAKTLLKYFWRTRRNMYVSGCCRTKVSASIKHFLLETIFIYYLFPKKSIITLCTKGKKHFCCGKVREWISINCLGLKNRLKKWDWTH